VCVCVCARVWLCPHVDVGGCVCVGGGRIPSIITKAFNATVPQFFCHSAVSIINVWGNIN